MGKKITSESVATAMSEIEMWKDLIEQGLNSLQAVRQVLNGEELKTVEKAILENIQHYGQKIAKMAEFEKE